MTFTTIALPQEPTVTATDASDVRVLASARGGSMAHLIPVGTSFQFRSVGARPFAAVGVTLPPWSGPDEAEEGDGPWTAI